MSEPAEEQPQEEQQQEEQPQEEQPQAPAVTAETVKAMAPADAWAAHPDLKVKYDETEEKEGILTEDEAGWGDKADEFLEKNADAYADKSADAGEASAVEAKEPDPEPYVKTLTAEEVEKLETDVQVAKWNETKELAGKDKLGKLVRAAFNGMLDCAVPLDVMSLGKTNKDLYTRFGRTRMQKEHMRWNKLKGVYTWEKNMGGPLWNFPEGKTTELDGPADNVVNKEFVEQSKEGRSELKFGTKISGNSKVDQATYEAIVRRALENRLEANGLKGCGIELTDYQAEAESTFTVTHTVLQGDVLGRAQTAVERQMAIKALVKELKKAKNLVAEAVLNSQDIEERTADLKKKEPEDMADIDAAAPILSLREATKDSQEKIRDSIKQLEEKASDAVFAEKVAEGAGEGKQVDYRVNLARRLRIWLEAQQDDIASKVDAANKELLDKSMSGGDEELVHTTPAVKVDGDEKKAPSPEFLKEDRTAAVKLLHTVFKAAIKETLGDDAEAEKKPNDDHTEVTWEVKLTMDV